MSERAALTKTSENKGKNPVGAKQKENFYESMDSPVEQIFHLQRTIGNQAVQRLIKSGTIQAKLKIGQPNDKYEQEADRVAEKVMSMPEPKQSLVNSHWSLGKKVTPSIQRQEQPGEEEEKNQEEEQIQTKPIVDQITPLIQRQADEEEEPIKTKLIQRQEKGEEEEPIQTKLVQRQETEEEEEDKIQRQPQEDEEKEPIQTKQGPSQTPAVTSNIESSVNSLKGGGQPLPESTRSYFETRFGTDFSNVRVHTDYKAAETAKSINAKAFTSGKDVVFGAGQYSPGTSKGKSLLAHELTHVVQQKKNEFINKKFESTSNIMIQRTESEESTDKPRNTRSGTDIITLDFLSKNPFFKGIKIGWPLFEQLLIQAAFKLQGKPWRQGGPFNSTPKHVQYYMGIWSKIYLPRLKRIIKLLKDGGVPMSSVIFYIALAERESTLNPKAKGGSGVWQLRGYAGTLNRKTKKDWIKRGGAIAHDLYIMKIRAKAASGLESPWKLVEKHLIKAKLSPPKSNDAKEFQIFAAKISEALKDPVRRIHIFKAQFLGNLDMLKQRSSLGFKSQGRKTRFHNLSYWDQVYFSSLAYNNPVLAGEAWKKQYHKGRMGINRRDRKRYWKSDYYAGYVRTRAKKLSEEFQYLYLKHQMYNPIKRHTRKQTMRQVQEILKVLEGLWIGHFTNYSSKEKIRLAVRFTLMDKFTITGKYSYLYPEWSRKNIIKGTINGGITYKKNKLNAITGIHIYYNWDEKYFSKIRDIKYSIVRKYVAGTGYWDWNPESKKELIGKWGSSRSNSNGGDWILKK